MKDLSRLALLLPLFLSPACGEAGGHDHDHDHDHDGHDHGAEDAGGHHHEAPHGGALVVFGEEFAHVEVTLHSASGRLDLYVLDGGAEMAIRLGQEVVEVVVEAPGEGAKGAGAIELSLAAQASAGTGETVGDSSQFSVTDERLKGLDKFQARLRSITIKGQTFPDVAFRYPEGNE